MNRRHLSYAALWLLLCSLIPIMAQENRATVREYQKVFRTYPYSDPNPIPVMGKVYPYFRFDMYTDQGVDQEWTVVELENDYIRVMILPEIGGKIWTAIEKSSGRPFIYYNQVVKFRDIAMRGPWTSGGIEPNYGIIGHTPNCATPVDYLTRRNADGSVSAVIGTLDLLTRTPWRLEITLPSDCAYFTTRSFWHNATPLEQPYYTWMNTGIKATGNLEFVYPGTQYLGHNGEYSSWPVHPTNGRNLAWYEKNDFGGPKSYHVFGAYTDFFGGYWHDEDFGMARFSSRDDKAGKKIWIWGLSRQGMIWEKLLTDSDGQYVEVQSGRLFNQSAEQSTLTPFKHRGFAPYATDTWTEYWFPVKGTKGFVKANRYGALNVQHSEGKLTLLFSPLQRLKSTLEVFDGESRIHSRQLEMKPMQTWIESIPIAVSPGRLRVRIDGAQFDYQADPANGMLSRPLDAPQAFDWESVYGLYLKGKEFIRQRMYPEAQTELAACLRKDPNYLPARADMAALRYRAMDYRAAFEQAHWALRIDSYDPAANYYYGLACLQLGKLTDARDGFEVASMSVEFRGAAWTELAKIYLHEGDPERALDYAQRSLEFNRLNLDAHQLMAVAYRLGGDRIKANAILQQILDLDPLNHLARFEAYLLDGLAQSKQTFVSGIRNELPQETFLELAAWYFRLGRWSEATKVLESAPPTAEILYWLAWLENRRGGDFRQILARADAASPRLVFPSRSESAEVLEWAVGVSPSWRPKYYLALILWSRNETAKARDLMTLCGMTPDYAPFYAARSQAFKPVSAEQSLADLLRAAELDSSQWRFGRLLSERYIEQGSTAKALETAQRYSSAESGNYILGMLYAKTLLLNKRYREAGDLLSRLNILPYEGATEGRRLYRESQLMSAIEELRRGSAATALHYVEAAKRWPENLGVGMPYPESIDERLENWLEYDCRQRLGRQQEANAILPRIIGPSRRTNDTGTLTAALALRQLGQATEAQKLLDEWAKRQPDRLLAAWGQKILHDPATPVPAQANADEQCRVLSEWLQLTGRNRSFK